MSKSKRTKALDISKSVKDIVWERDNHRCIVCGSTQAMPNAHYISRAKGGLGIEQNIVTLCMWCHRKYDQSLDRERIGKIIKEYLDMLYPNFTERIYKKC